MSNVTTLIPENCSKADKYLEMLVSVNVITCSGRSDTYIYLVFYAVQT
jgi:hypothetical protein